MTSKKRIVAISSISVVVAVMSIFYVALETIPVGSTVGTSQYANLSFENLVELSDVIFVGSVIDVGVKLVRDDIYHTSENGTEYVYMKVLKPYQAVTIDVHEYLKDTTGQFANPVTILDQPNGQIGEKDGLKTRFWHIDAVDYPIGHKALYFAEKFDEGFRIIGFASRHDITEDADGEEIYQSGLNKVVGKEPRKLNDSLEYARELLSDK